MWVEREIHTTNEYESFSLVRSMNAIVILHRKLKNLMTFADPTEFNVDCAGVVV